MPLTGPRAEDTDIRMIAGHEKRITRLEQRKSGGFDPNADPVVIGLNADGHASPRSVAIGTGASVLDPTDPTDTGYEGVAIGADSYAGADGALALGTQAAATAVASTAIGYGTSADGESAVALGPSAAAEHLESVAIGALAQTTAAHQIMLGTNQGFVEIPGNSGSHPNGLVLTDTATSTRYIVQITSGALVLSAAP